MSSIPVVDVSCAVFDAAGAPVNGAIVTFRLNRVATVNGTIVPSYVTVTTASDGTATARLCPNTLCGGSYGVRITAAGIDSRGVAVVPNEDCALDGIFQPVPYPADTLIEAAIAQITISTAQAQDAAAQAMASETQAAASKDSAVASETAAAASASDANGSAVAAAASDASAALSLQAIVTAGTYARDMAWAAKGTSVAADRYTLLSPASMAVTVGVVGFSLAAQAALDLSLAASWDSTATDYRVAANRAGKDFYVYACDNAGALKLLISANSTYPSGYTAGTSRKIGGFHCLCAAVGTISGHSLSGYAAGDILPASIWDLKHRPVASPEGMVYVSGIGKWADIYLSSVSGGALASVCGGTIADGTSTPAFHWYKFSQWLGQTGKRLPTQHEFVALSLGSNQGTNIAGSADPVTTGGHSDTSGQRMISQSGCEDCCGAMWQWSGESGGPYAAASWVAAYDANDSGVGGRSYYAPNRAVLGGSWDAGVTCGSRGSGWDRGPLGLSAGCGVRGVAEPLAVAL